jgi:hypothetical protein
VKSVNGRVHAVIIPDSPRGSVRGGWVFTLGAGRIPFRPARFLPLCPGECRFGRRLRVPPGIVRSSHPDRHTSIG